MRCAFGLAACALFGLSAPLVASAQTAPSTPAPVLQSSAAAYVDYQGEVSNVGSKPLKDAAALDKALDFFGARNAEQLSSGWISYTSMVAAQDGDFAAGVKDAEAKYGRQQVLDGLRLDPSYARKLAGGDKALQAALTANTADTSRVSSAAAKVKEQAYKLQDITWGKSKLKNPSGRAADLKAAAKSEKPVTDAAMKLLVGPDFNAMLASASTQKGAVWDRVSLLTASAPTAALTSFKPGASTAAKEVTIDPKRESTANRIVQVGALRVLDAEANAADDVKTAIKDRPTFDCIDWSQLQLQACVSAAYTRADLSFCLAEHAIGEAGACFGKVTR